VHVLNTTLPAHLSLFAYLDFACYSPLWSLSLFAYLDFLRATHLFGISRFLRTSTLRATHLFGVSRFLRPSTLRAADHHVVVVSFWRQRTHVSFDWPPHTLGLRASSAQGFGIESIW